MYLFITITESDLVLYFQLYVSYVFVICFPGATSTIFISFIIHLLNTKSRDQKKRYNNNNNIIHIVVRARRRGKRIEGEIMTMTTTMTTSSDEMGKSHIL